MKFSEYWTTEKIARIRDNVIFKKLRRYGIRVNKRSFRQSAKNYISASQIAELWITKYQVRQHYSDQDFIYCAAFALWYKHCPDIVGVHELDILMHKGYDFLRTDQVDKSCRVWWHTWEKLKVIIRRHQITDWDAIEDVSGNMYGWEYWHSDFVDELWNAALTRPYFHAKRLQFCLEMNELFKCYMEREKLCCAIVECHLAMGEEQKAEIALEKFNRDYPDSAWGYICMADMYSHFAGHNNRLPYNSSKALSIYQQVLDAHYAEDGIHNLVEQRIQDLLIS